MASGVPCIVAVEGLISDVLERSNAGKTVPFGDTQGLIKSISDLLIDGNERRLMSQNARNYAEAHFNPDRVADAYESALKLILKS
jgi:glycosyltransferase involved in cell wall biosynthesis